MDITQDLWDMLAGKDEGPDSSGAGAKAEAAAFFACLRLGKMTLQEVCETIAVSGKEAAGLAAFVGKHPEEEIIVMSAIEFRSLVAERLDNLLRGGNNVFPIESPEFSGLDFGGSDDFGDCEGII